MALNNFESKAMIAPVFGLAAEDIESFYVVAITAGFDPDTGPYHPENGKEIQILTATNIADYLVRNLFGNMLVNNMLRGARNEPTQLKDLIGEAVREFLADNDDLPDDVETALENLERKVFGNEDNPDE